MKRQTELLEVLFEKLSIIGIFHTRTTVLTSARSWLTNGELRGILLGIMNFAIHIKEDVTVWSTSCRRKRLKEVILVRIRIDHAKYTHNHLLNNMPRPFCEDCLISLSITHTDGVSGIQCAEAKKFRYWWYSTTICWSSPHTSWWWFSCCCCILFSPWDTLAALTINIDTLPIWNALPFFIWISAFPLEGNTSSLWSLCWMARSDPVWLKCQWRKVPRCSYS